MNHGTRRCHRVQAVTFTEQKSYNLKMQYFTKNYVENFIKLTKLQSCTIMVEYFRVGTTSTLAPRLFPILRASLCTSIRKPGTLHKVQYLLDRHVGKVNWAQEMMAQVPKS